MDKMLILLQQLHLENEVSALKHAYIERVIVPYPSPSARH